MPVNFSTCVGPSICLFPCKNAKNLSNKSDISNLFFELTRYYSGDQIGNEMGMQSVLEEERCIQDFGGKS